MKTIMKIRIPREKTIIRYSILWGLTILGTILGIFLLGRPIVLLVGFLLILGGIWKVSRKRKAEQTQRIKIALAQAQEEERKEVQEIISRL